MNQIHAQVDADGYLTYFGRIWLLAGRVLKTGRWDSSTSIASTQRCGKLRRSRCGDTWRPCGEPWSKKQDRLQWAFFLTRVRFTSRMFHPNRWNRWFISFNKATETVLDRSEFRRGVEIRCATGRSPAAHRGFRECRRTFPFWGRTPSDRTFAPAGSLPGFVTWPSPAETAPGEMMVLLKNYW